MMPQLSLSHEIVPVDTSDITRTILSYEKGKRIEKEIPETRELFDVYFAREHSVRMTREEIDRLKLNDSKLVDPSGEVPSELIPQPQSVRKNAQSKRRYGTQGNENQLAAALDGKE